MTKPPIDSPHHERDLTRPEGLLGCAVQRLVNLATSLGTELPPWHPLGGIHVEQCLPLCWSRPLSNVYCFILLTLSHHRDRQGVWIGAETKCWNPPPPSTREHGSSAPRVVAEGLDERYAAADVWRHHPGCVESLHTLHDHRGPEFSIFKHTLKYGGLI